MCAQDDHRSKSLAWSAEKLWGKPCTWKKEEKVKKKEDEDRGADAIRTATKKTKIEGRQMSGNNYDRCTQPLMSLQGTEI